MRTLLVISIVLLLLSWLAGCEQPVTPPDPTGRSTTIGDTSYVEIFPPWGGFASPRAIMVGNDQLIYVADYDSNQIVMKDASGVTLKTRGILHPTAIAQDSKFDLLVGGETIAPNGSDTIGAIFRISLVRFDTVYQYGISVDPFTGDTTKLFRDTSYFYAHDLATAPLRVVWQETGRPARRFTGIGVLPGNGYLAARNGPDNTSFVDPDARVLLFDKADRLETPLGDLITRSSDATGITDIKDLTGLFVIPSSRDFILTQSNSGNAYGAVWMVYEISAERQGWAAKFNPAIPAQQVDFTVRSRFVRASAVAYDRRRREVFILDTALDSVVKFNRNGQFRGESFGRYRTTSAEFPGLLHPGGIAFSNDCTLYVTDTGHQVIRRFRLSAQTQCN